MHFLKSRGEVLPLNVGANLLCASFSPLQPGWSTDEERCLKGNIYFRVEEHLESVFKFGMIRMLQVF